MKRTLRYALMVVMGASLTVPVFAQDMYPDTPDNHWAYEALLRLKKDGLLSGYPDGLFRGTRPPSRYEMAVAIHAAYQKLHAAVPTLESQIQALNKSLDGKADKSEIDNLKQTLDAIRKDLDGMKGWAADIENLKKLTDKFGKEIESLGVDIGSMKKDLEDIKSQVAKVEETKPAIDIHGTIDLAMYAGYAGRDRSGTANDEFGITVDGRPTGMGRNSYDGNAVGMFRDLTVLHELALDLKSEGQKGIDWKATLVVGNALDSETGLGGQSETLDGRSFRDGSQSVYFQNFEIAIHTALAGQKIEAQVGRTGYHINPYILKRHDTTPYFANERWDSEDWIIDGAIVKVPIGAVTVGLIFGRNSDQTASGSNSTELQPMLVGKSGVPIYLDGSDRPRGTTSGNNLNLPVETTAGVRATINVAKDATVDLSYLWLVSNHSELVNGVEADRVVLMGAETKFKLSAFDVNLGYAQSDLQRGWHRIITKDNSATWASVAYEKENWGASAGYKRILPLYTAPGDWGRIGIWWDPTDIEGYELNAHAKINPKMTLKGSAEFYTGTDNGALDGATVDQLGFNSDDKVNRYVVGLDYQSSSKWLFSLGYERVEWNLKSRTTPAFVGGKPTETWINLGFNYSLSALSKFSMLWQMSDYNSKGVAGFGPFADGNGNPDRASGGLLTTQLSIKF